MRFIKRSEPYLMKSAQCTEPKNFTIVNIPINDPGDGEVLVKLEGCGVCGSNLPVWDGRSWFNYPLENGAPGHEGWGQIEAVGKNVVDYKIGERVAILSGHAFAQYEVVSMNTIVKLPSDIDSMPFPGEPIGCAMNVFQRSQIQAGQKVVIIGAGFLGILLIQLAVKKGAEVIAVSKRKCSLDLANKSGASHCIPLTDTYNVVSKIRQCSGEIDCIIEATGYQQSIDIATEIISNYGRLIIAGYHQDGIRTINLQQWNWKCIDVINAHERDLNKYLQGIKNATSAIVNRELDYLPLITHYFPFEKINSAFETMKNRPEGFIKAVVMYV